MGINWDIKNPPAARHSWPRRAWRTLRGVLFNTNVPMHMSNHYTREHFEDVG